MVTIRFAQVVASTGFVSVECNALLCSKGSSATFAGDFPGFARVFEGFLGFWRVFSTLYGKFHDFGLIFSKISQKVW